MSELTRYRLSELYELSSGISSKPEQAGHGYPFCSFSTVFNNTFLPDELPDLMDTSNQERIIYSIKEGDVFLTRTSETVEELGMSSVAVKDYPNATFSGFLKRLRPITDKTYAKYMALFFRSRYFRKTVTNKAVMTLRASFNEDIFNDIFIDLPSIEDQRKIGDLLFNIECHARNNNALCSELESMAKLIYDYWFIQFDFPDENGKPYKSSGGKMVWNEELKREIPEGWEVVPFGDCITSINTGLNPRDNFKLNTGGTIKYLTVKNLTKEGIIDFSSCDVIDENARSIVHRRSDIKVGDILFASIAPLGRCSMIIEEPTDWDINESVFSIRPCSENMTTVFLYMTFMSEAFVRKAEGSSAGSVFKGIRISELQDLKTFRPPMSTLKAFDSAVYRLFETKENAITENHQLVSLRDFLLPMLMNGQVKVGKAGE